MENNNVSIGLIVFLCLFVGAMVTISLSVVNKQGSYYGFCNGIYGYYGYDQVDRHNITGNKLVHCVGEYKAGWFEFPTPVEVYPTQGELK